MSVSHHTALEERNRLAGPRLATEGDALAEAIDSLGVVMSFTKDEEIYGQGEDADLVYRLVSGCVRTTRYLSDGRRHIGAFYYPGDVFGVEPGPEHRFSAEGLGDCEVVVLKRTALRRQIERDPSLERKLWALTVRELEHAQDLMLLLGRKTACEKVASFILDMSDRARSDRFDMPMGRQDMADHLGLTIETVSRMLTQLQQSNVIEISGCRTFRIVSRAALTNLSE